MLGDQSGRSQATSSLFQRLTTARARSHRARSSTRSAKRARIRGMRSRTPMAYRRAARRHRQAGEERGPGAPMGGRTDCDCPARADRECGNRRWREVVHRVELACRPLSATVLTAVTVTAPFARRDRWERTSQRDGHTQGRLFGELRAWPPKTRSRGSLSCHRSRPSDDPRQHAGAGRVTCQQLEKRILADIDRFSPEALMTSWLPLVPQGAKQIQAFFRSISPPTSGPPKQ